MTEEENKAIGMLDKFITEHKLYNIKQSDGLEDNIKIALNLIEKLNYKINLNELDRDYVNRNYILKDKIRELIKEPAIITDDGDYISVKKVKKLLEEE